jgi:hypothetical protein
MRGTSADDVSTRQGKQRVRGDVLTGLCAVKSLGRCQGQGLF